MYFAQSYEEGTARLRLNSRSPDLSSVTYNSETILTQGAIFIYFLITKSMLAYRNKSKLNTHAKITINCGDDALPTLPQTCIPEVFHSTCERSGVYSPLSRGRLKGSTPNTHTHTPSQRTQSSLQEPSVITQS